MRNDLKIDVSFQAMPELINALLAYGSALTHPANTVLFERGKKAHGLFLLQSGSARLSVPGALEFHVRSGSLLGVPGTLSKGVYSLTAELLEESQVLFVPSDRVSVLLSEHPEIGFLMVQVLSREIQALRQRIVELDEYSIRP